MYHQLPLDATARMRAALFILMLSILVYAVAILREKSLDVSEGVAKHPPMVPYWVPFLGHLISWQRDSHALATKFL
jgi:hypothetical protein